jgi:hypothetical protein
MSRETHGKERPLDYQKIREKDIGLSFSLMQTKTQEVAKAALFCELFIQALPLSASHVYKF